MNLVEAKRDLLIREPRSDMKLPLLRRRWHLILDIKNNNKPVVSKEKFTTEEVQGLIDLLEKVRKEPP